MANSWNHRAARVLLCLPFALQLACGLNLDNALMQLTLQSRDPLGAEQQQTQPDCFTAAKGDACHEEVSWAMEVGIVEHPDWYPTLTQDSSFEAFQRVLSGMERVSGVCRAPCEAQCHTAAPGETCHEEVMYAMSQGIAAHPEWYPTLTNSSSFQEVQQFLHGLSRLSQVCAKPCGRQATLMGTDTCRTAAEGDECWTEVLYAMNEGIKTNPERYPTLTSGSTFEDFQEHLHGLSRLSDVCAKPCRAPAPPSGARLPAQPSVYPIIDGYTQVATNCDCGASLRDYGLQETATEAECARMCDKMDECKGFALWSQTTTLEIWRGHCRLYSDVCPSTNGWDTGTSCRKPTSSSDDPYVREENVGYNRYRFPTPAPTSIPTAAPTVGPTLAPGQVCPCEKCGNFPFWDLDGDGCLVPEEASKAGLENFRSIDTNSDGCIDREECDATDAGVLPKTIYRPGPVPECDFGSYLNPDNLAVCEVCSDGSTRRRVKNQGGECVPCAWDAFDAGDFDDCIDGIYLTEDVPAGSNVLNVNKVEGIATRDHIFIATRIPGHFEEAVVVGLPGGVERRRLGAYNESSAGIVLDEPLQSSYSKYDAITVTCSNRDGVNPSQSYPCGCGATVCPGPSICHMNLGGELTVDPRTGKASGSAGICEPIDKLPTPAPTVSAKGDPHLVNLQGEHFDINHGGEFDMLRVPKDTRKPAEFVLKASIHPEFGKPCTTFITELELSGTWFEHKVVKVRSFLQSHSRDASDKFLGIQVLEPGAPEPPWTAIANWSAQDLLLASTSHMEVTVSKTQWSSKKRVKAGMPTLAGQFVFYLRNKRSSEAAKVIVRQDLPVQEHLNVAVRRLSALGNLVLDVGGLLGFGGHPDSLEDVTPECQRHRDGLDGKKAPRTPAWKTRWSKIREQRRHASADEKPRENEAAASFMCVCQNDEMSEDAGMADQDEGTELQGIVADFQTARLMEVSWE